jgi:hypothetical protein
MRQFLLASVVGALLVLGAGTAQAAPSAPRVQSPEGGVGALAGCTADSTIRLVDKSGHHIRGYGGFFGCTSRPYATIEVQRHRWYGWQTMRSWTGTFVPGNYYYLFYDCANTGTHTFRTIMHGRTVGGSPWFRESRHFRTSC